jgi:FMN-dependent NADH-azoreductase
MKILQINSSARSQGAVSTLLADEIVSFFYSSLTL